MPGVYGYRVHAFNLSPTADSLSNVSAATVGGVIDHSMGFGTSIDLTGNGDTQFAANVARLTRADLQTGSFFAGTRLTIAQFTTSFLVRLSEGTQPNYADGFTFVIQANDPTALGQGLGGLGYQGINNSVAVKFGTFQYPGDPSNSSTGLVVNGAAPRGGVTTGSVLLNSQNPKQVDLNYNGTTLTETVTDTLTGASFSTTFTVNIPLVIGSDQAYLGFTASTGSPGASSFWELQDIGTWQFSSRAPLPGSPSNLRVSATSDSEIDLAWNGNSFNETGFRIERSVDGGATFTEVGTSSSTSFADRNLARGSYYYRVLAYNAAGNSSFTNVVGATVPPNDPPPVITGITRSNFTVKPNGTLTLTVAFTDPDPNDQHTAIINWGDNSSPTTMPLAGGVVQFTASHSYLNAPSGANFPIRIAVQDDDGGNDTVTLAVSAASVTPPPGLADWYTGDGFTPSAAADIAGNNPGTLVGGVTYLPGEVGNAFNFNGTDAYVRLPNNFIPFPSSGTSNAPLSFTAWFETTAGGVILGQQGGPALAGAPAGWVPAVYVGTDGKLRVQLFWNGGVNSVTSPAPVNDGRFHFVAVSSDGFTESVYLDNQFLGTTSGLQASYTNNYFYQLGTGYTAGDWQAVTGGWYSFRGLVDEVQFYNAAISASAIQGIYNAGSAGQVKGVMAVDLPPVLAGLSRSAFSLNENGTFTLQGTFSDPQPGDPHTAVINWGDGSPETTVPVGASTFTFSAPHRYVDEPSSGPGYPIRVTLRDIAGGSDSVLLTANALAITPPSGLVGWWTGDGTNPAIAPDIAGNHPGFLGSGVTYSPGRVDNAFSFDGSTSASVNIANAADLNITSGATWDFWVNTTQANVFTGLVGKHDPTTSLNGVTSFIWPTGVAAVQIKNASQVLTLIGNSRVNDGLFHHIALTFQSGATARLYVDGRQQDSGTAPAFSFNPNPLRFGRLSDPFWQTLRGSLDEVQVFNRILSADEIQGIVNAGGAGQVKAVTVLDPAVVATGGFTINTVAGMGTGPVTVAAFSDPPGAEGLSHYSALINWGDNSTPSRGTITGPNSNGVFTVLGDHDYTTAGRLPITVTISHDRSPDATANSTAVVAPAPADHFGIQAPAARPASSPFIILVTALDRFANVATGYRGTITFSGSDPQALFEPNYPFTADDNGTHSFAVVLFTAGNQSITVTDTQDPSIFGTQANIRVTPLAPASLRVAGFPIPAASGASLPFVVSALDRYGNVATDYQGTISLGSSDPRAVFDFPSYQFTAEDNGSHTFHGLLRTLGNQSISTVDSDNQFFAMQSDITVIPARLEVSGFPSPTRAGAAGTFTVRVVDFDGNVLPDYHGTVSFISSDPIAVLPRDYAFTTGPGGDNGIHVFGAILKTAGTQAITATDTLFTTVGGTQENIIVSPSPVAGSFRVFNIPSPIVAGTSATVMVTVYDPYGNISTPYRGTIHFRTDPNDPMADLPEDYTFVASDNGTATFPAGVTLRKAGTVSVIVADTVNGATGSQDVVVTPANAVGFLVYGFVSPTQAGALHPFRVNPVDAFGNTGAPYSGTVTFASTDPAANLPNDTPFVAGDDGSMEFFAALNTVGTQSIFATDTVDGSITGSQDNIDVVSGAGAPGPGGGRGRLPWQAVTASDLSANDAANHRRLSVLSWQAADKRQLRTNYGMTQGNLNLGSQPPQIRPAHRYRTDILDLFFGEWSNGVNLGSVLDSSQKWIAPPLVSEG